MGSYGEVDVGDFLRLMADYLKGRITADQYKQDYFSLMKKRQIVSDHVSRVLQ